MKILNTIKPNIIFIILIILIVIIIIYIILRHYNVIIENYDCKPPCSDDEICSTICNNDSLYLYVNDTDDSFNSDIASQYDNYIGIYNKIYNIITNEVEYINQAQKTISMSFNNDSGNWELKNSDTVIDTINNSTYKSNNENIPIGIIVKKKYIAIMKVKSCITAHSDKDEYSGTYYFYPYSNEIIGKDNNLKKYSILYLNTEKKVSIIKSSIIQTDVTTDDIYNFENKKEENIQKSSTLKFARWVVYTYNEKSKLSKNAIINTMLYRSPIASSEIIKSNDNRPQNGPYKSYNISTNKYDGTIIIKNIGFSCNELNKKQFCLIDSDCSFYNSKCGPDTSCQEGASPLIRSALKLYNNLQNIQYNNIIIYYNFNNNIYVFSITGDNNVISYFSKSITGNCKLILPVAFNVNKSDSITDAIQYTNNIINKKNLNDNFSYILNLLKNIKDQIYYNIFKILYIDILNLSENNNLNNSTNVINKYNTGYCSGKSVYKLSLSENDNDTYCYNETVLDVKSENFNKCLDIYNDKKYGSFQYDIMKDDCYFYNNSCKYDKSTPIIKIIPLPNDPSINAIGIYDPNLYINSEGITPEEASPLINKILKVYTLMRNTKNVNLLQIMFLIIIIM